MASQMFDEAALRLVARSGNTIDFLSDTIKVMLLTAYTPVKTHQYVSDVLGADGVELSTTGYAGGFSGSGRKTLAGKSISKDTTNHQIVFTATNPVWTGLGPATSGPTITGALLYKSGTADSDSPVLAWLAASVTVNGGQVTLTFDSTNGAFRQTI